MADPVDTKVAHAMAPDIKAALDRVAELERQLDEAKVKTESELTAKLDAASKERDALRARVESHEKAVRAEADGILEQLGDKAKERLEIIKGKLDPETWLALLKQERETVDHAPQDEQEPTGKPPSLKSGRQTPKPKPAPGEWALSEDSKQFIRETYYKEPKYLEHAKVDKIDNKRTYTIPREKYEAFRRARGVPKPDKT